MKRAYEVNRLGPARLRIVELANAIIDEYVAQDYRLTLRQLFYQLVARGHLENDQRRYKALSETLTRARMAGLVDWTAIVDRTRELGENSHWRSPAELLRTAAAQYRRDTWADSSAYAEIWIEKEALAEIVERAGRRLDIPWFCCRGYGSTSAFWEAAERIRDRAECRDAHVFYLGDHDPSGLDMTRDIEKRLETFDVVADVRRIALNIDQIEEHRPPPNPVKLKDTRAPAYVAQFGTTCWELDALDPPTLIGLIEGGVLGVADVVEVGRVQERQEREREALEAIAEHHAECAALAAGLKERGE